MSKYGFVPVSYGVAALTSPRWQSKLWWRVGLTTIRKATSPTIDKMAVPLKVIVELYPVSPRPPEAVAHLVKLVDDHFVQDIANIDADLVIAAAEQ